MLYVTMWIWALRTRCSGLIQAGPLWRDNSRYCNQYDIVYLWREKSSTWQQHRQLLLMFSQSTVLVLCGCLFRTFTVNEVTYNCKKFLFFHFSFQNSTSSFGDAFVRNESEHIFISVINQLDAQKFCFTISLFHASTCFEHLCSSSGGQNSITQQPLVSSHV